jgi:hypothetical protein
MEEYCSLILAMDEHPTVELSARYIYTPSRIELALRFGLYLLEREILFLIKENCYGCRVDHPSQRNHMTNGCLSDWFESVEENFDLAVLRLSPEKVQPYLCHVSGLLELDDELTFEEVLNADCLRELVESMCIDRDFDLLFDLEA